MSDLIAKLWQAIGRYGAEVAQDGRLAPPQYLCPQTAKAADIQALDRLEARE